MPVTPAAPTAAAELSFAPDRSVYVRRSLTVGGITFAVLVALGLTISAWVDISPLWTLPTALLFTCGFFFDDVMRWRTNRFDRWQISDGHLIHDGQDGSARIPLDDIADVFSPLGNRVVIELSSGQRIALRYLPYPREAVAQIRGALPARPPS